MDRAELFGRRRFGVRLGLDSLRSVDALLGQPCEGLPCVSIVGTNGKGSTAAMVAHGLRGRGLVVGLFTSPHMSRVEERIRIDGELVSAAKLDAALALVQTAEREADVALTFFEILTLASLCCFRDAGVQALVLEAGLGGRLDSTRLRRRDVVLVARIGLDHQQWLGDTLEAIAEEKIAILEPGSHAITQAQPDGVLDVLHRHATRMGDHLEFSVATSRPPKGLWGDHQRHNAGLALAGLAAICRRIPQMTPLPPTLEELDGVRWPGRLEWLSRDVLGEGVSEERGSVAGSMLIDVAHNPDGVRALTAAVRELPSWRPSIVVFGALADKDAGGMLEALAPLLAGAELWHLLLDAPDGGGASRDVPLSAEALGVTLARTWTLAAHADEAADGTPQPAPTGDVDRPDGTKGTADAAHGGRALTMRELARRLSALVAAGERVLVCGSFHLVGPLRAAVMEPAEQPSADPNDPRHAHSLRGSPVAR